MIKSGMFNSVNGDRKYKAEDFARYFATFIGNGVFPNPSDGLQVTENGDMSVNVSAGQGWINGYYITNDADYNLTLDVADGVLNRIDRVVMQLNYLNREITLLIKKGTFASSPVAPELQRDADVYELGLADIYIGKGVVSITQANITDLRLNNDLCGIVHGTVDQVDTTTLFAQYESWYSQTIGEAGIAFENMQQQLKADFLDWFQSIQDILDENVAANLVGMITQLESQLESQFTSHKADDVLHNISVKVIKSNKDDEGIFTTIEHRRKSDDTLARKSVLSGGESPLYTTRTVTYYAADGTTVLKTDIFTLSYDSEGDLIGEV